MFELAWAHARIEHHHRVQAEDYHLYQKLAGHLLYPVGPLRAAPATCGPPTSTPVTGLWGLGLSGDLPIALLRLEGRRHDIVRQLLRAPGYWRIKSRVDLVILIERAPTMHDRQAARRRWSGRAPHVAPDATRRAGACSSGRTG